MGEDLLTVRAAAGLDQSLAGLIGASATGRRIKVYGVGSGDSAAGVVGIKYAAGVGNYIFYHTGQSTLISPHSCGGPQANFFVDVVTHAVGVTIYYRFV